MLARFTLLVSRWLKTQRKIKLKFNINQSKTKINPNIIYVETGSVEAGNVVGERVRIREGKDKKVYGRETLLLSLKVQSKPPCQT